MSRFSLPTPPWSFITPATLIGAVLLAIFIHEEVLALYHPESDLQTLIPDNSPVASLNIPDFLPLASKKDMTASYLFQDVLKQDTLALSPPPELILRPKVTAPIKKLPYYDKYVPVSKGVSPNSIRLHRSQVPLPVSAKNVNGKLVCADKKDKPGKSNQNRRAHIDRQCCLDPDEVPNPHCTY